MSLLNTVVILITALNWFSSAVTFSAEGIPYSTVYVQGEQREIEHSSCQKQRRRHLLSATDASIMINLSMTEIF